MKSCEFFVPTLSGKPGRCDVCGDTRDAHPKELALVEVPARVPSEDTSRVPVVGDRVRRVDRIADGLDVVRRTLAQRRRRAVEGK